MKAPSRTTVKEAADAWLDGARSGAIRNRSGDHYKPSAIRSYEASLRLRVLPAFGGRKLSELRRSDVQEFVDSLVALELHPSTVQVTLLPLQAICRRAVSRGDLAVNPTTGIERPAVRSSRDRIASPDEAAKLIAAVPERDRALWATAMYGGLRRGELMALRWRDADLAAGVIRVHRGWDTIEGPIQTKGKERRTVPIAGVLRDHLVEHRIRKSEPGPDELVFGTGSRPFGPTGVRERADEAWEGAELDRITLHESRHTFASLMIAAGVNAKALSTYMGHSSIQVTYDKYGHLMPGNEEEAAGLLDAFLERADTAARVAQLDGP